MKRALTPEQIKTAKELKQDGYSKRNLARKFKVSPTTIWENVFAKTKRIRIYIRKEHYTRSGAQCKRCEIFLTREIKTPLHIPLNYQILDRCIGCYLEERGLKYKDLL